MRLLLILASMTICAVSNAQTLEIEYISTFEGYSSGEFFLRSSAFGLTVTTAVGENNRNTKILIIRENEIDSLVINGRRFTQTVLGNGILYGTQGRADSALASIDLETQEIQNIYTGEYSRFGNSLTLTRDYVTFFDHNAGTIAVRLETMEPFQLYPGWGTWMNGFCEAFTCLDTTYIFYENEFWWRRIGDSADAGRASGMSAYTGAIMSNDSVHWASRDGYYYSHSVANGGFSKKTILESWPFYSVLSSVGGHGALAHTQRSSIYDTTYHGYTYVDLSGKVNGTLAESFIAPTIFPSEDLECLTWYDGWFYGIYSFDYTKLVLFRIKGPDPITIVEELTSMISTRTSIQYISNQQLCDMLNEREEETQVFDVRGERIIDCSSARGLVALKRSNGYELFFTVP